MVSTFSGQIVCQVCRVSGCGLPDGYFGRSFGVDSHFFMFIFIHSGLWAADATFIRCRRSVLFLGLIKPGKCEKISEMGGMEVGL